MTDFFNPIDLYLDKNYIAQAGNIHDRYAAPKIAFVDSSAKLKEAYRTAKIKIRKGEPVKIDHLEHVAKTVAQTNHVYTTKLQTEYFILIYNKHIEELNLFHDKCYLECIKKKFLGPLMTRVENMAVINRDYVDPSQFSRNSKITIPNATSYDGTVDDLKTKVNANPSLLSNARDILGDSMKSYTFKNPDTDALFLNLDLQGVNSVTSKWLETPLAVIGQVWRLLYVNCVIPLKIMYESMEKISKDLIYTKTILGNKELFNTKVHFLAMETSRILLGRLHKYIIDFYQLVMRIHEHMNWGYGTEREKVNMNIFTNQFRLTPFLLDAQTKDNLEFVNRLFGMLICLSQSFEIEDVLNPNNTQSIARTLDKYYFPTHYDVKGKNRVIAFFNMITFKRDTTLSRQQLQASREKLCFTIFEFPFQFEDFLNELSTNIYVQDVLDGSVTSEEIFKKQFILDETSTTSNIEPIFGKGMFDAMYKKNQSYILHNDGYLKLMKMRDEALNRNDGTAAAILLLPSQNIELANDMIEGLLQNSASSDIGVAQEGSDISIKDPAKVNPIVIDIPYDASALDTVSPSYALSKSGWIDRYKPYKAAYTTIGYASNNNTKEENEGRKRRNNFWDNDTTARTLHTWLFGIAPQTSINTSSYNTKAEMYRLYSEMVQYKGEIGKRFVTKRLRETETLFGIVVTWTAYKDSTENLYDNLNNIKPYYMRDRDEYSTYYEAMSLSSSKSNYWRQTLSSMYSYCQSLVPYAHGNLEVTGAISGKVAAYMSILLLCPKQLLHLLPQVYSYMAIKFREFVAERVNSKIVTFFIDVANFILLSPFRRKMTELLGWLIFYVVGWITGFGGIIKVQFAQIVSVGVRTVLSHFLSIQFTARVVRVFMASLYRCFKFGMMAFTTGKDISEFHVVSLVDRTVLWMHPGNPNDESIKASRLRTKTILAPIAYFLVEYFSTITDVLVGSAVYKFISEWLDSLIEPISVEIENAAREPEKEKTEEEKPETVYPEPIPTPQQRSMPSPQIYEKFRQTPYDYLSGIIDPFSKISTDAASLSNRIRTDLQDEGSYRLQDMSSIDDNPNIRSQRSDQIALAVQLPVRYMDKELKDGNFRRWNQFYKDFYMNSKPSVDTTSNSTIIDETMENNSNISAGNETSRYIDYMSELLPTRGVYRPPPEWTSSNTREPRIEIPTEKPEGAEGDYSIYQCAANGTAHETLDKKNSDAVYHHNGKDVEVDPSFVLFMMKTWSTMEGDENRKNRVDLFTSFFNFINSETTGPIATSLRESLIAKDRLNAKAYSDLLARLRNSSGGLSETFIKSIVDNPNNFNDLLRYVFDLKAFSVTRGRNDDFFNKPTEKKDYGTTHDTTPMATIFADVFRKINWPHNREEVEKLNNEAEQPYSRTGTGYSDYTNYDPDKYYGDNEDSTRITESSRRAAYRRRYYGDETDFNRDAEFEFDERPKREQPDEDISTPEPSDSYFTTTNTIGALGLTVLLGAVGSRMMTSTWGAPADVLYDRHIAGAKNNEMLDEMIRGLGPQGAFFRGNPNAVPASFEESALFKT